MKIAISFYYEWMLHTKFISGSIKIDGWGGVYGTVGGALNLTQSHYNTVKAVVDETIAELSKGQTYDPNRKPMNRQYSLKIQPSSLDMHQIAKLKVNSSFRVTANLYNACIRGPAGLPPIRVAS